MEQAGMTRRVAIPVAADYQPKRFGWRK